MSETVEWGNVCSRVDTCALTAPQHFLLGSKMPKFWSMGRCGVISMHCGIWKS